MRMFGAACIRLQDASHARLPDWLKLILLFLSVPCFQASHFCFKRAYAISLYRIRLAGFDSLLESIQNDTLKFNGFGAKSLSVAQTYHCLRDIERRANALVSAVKAYHSKYQRYPGSLNELVPEFAQRIPRAKYTLLFSFFWYGTDEGNAILFYVAVPPFGRRTYSFARDQWIYLD